MNSLLNFKIITLFNKAVATGEDLGFAYINEIAARNGYLVHPDVCNEGVLEFLNSLNYNLNSTFYKSWEDVTNKNRTELFLDQVRHYVSTYGTDFTGEVYLPDGDIVLPEMKNYKVILPITLEEVGERSRDMLYSGIALQQDVIQDLVSLTQESGVDVHFDKIKNKEALMIFHKLTNTLPVTPEEMVRYLVYLATGSTLLIKDQGTIALITCSSLNIRSLVIRFGEKKLSEVFHRFKPLFLSFKGLEENKNTVNRLRKLANIYHKPMPVNYFGTLLSNPKQFSQIGDHLDKLNNFRKIGLLQTINARLKEETHRFFPIRNQKIFVKEESVSLTNFDKQYYYMVYDVVYKSLIDSLKTKATTMKIPNGVSIKLPATAKSFIGNYPLGSSFDFTGSDNIVGINWKESDGARDLDLSLMSIDGTKYGWNAAYTNGDNSVIYSGDMTSANPEATELFYTKNSFGSALVKVNLFSGSTGSKFRFFLAKEPITNMSKNYMVNPDNVFINVEAQCSSYETILGVVTGTQFILAQFRSGNKHVSGSSITDLYTQHALDTLDSYLDLETVFTEAGFTIDEKNPEIDFGNLSKDTLINLLS